MIVRGVAERLKKKYWPKTTKPKQSSVESNFEEITMIHVVFVYCLLLGGFLTSLFVIVCEQSRVKFIGRSN